MFKWAFPARVLTLLCQPDEVICAWTIKQVDIPLTEAKIAINPCPLKITTTLESHGKHSFRVVDKTGVDKKGVDETRSRRR